MKIGEVCLLTNDVIGLANFYKQLLHIENGSSDAVHQFLIAEETAFTIYNDGTRRSGNQQNICLAFTVPDVEVEWERVKALGAQVVSPPEVKPWGAKSMSFLDPDGNLIFFRSFPNT